ncbi:MAG: polysaccharide biosynthesis C-terminal domain-containing protein [Saprospiraceae bacterium]|nr:polysaccharide biosynthesis C-terminal domain-containing protein [Saprospiraceae bacterium]
MLKQFLHLFRGFLGKDGISTYQRYFILRYISAILLSVAIVRSPLQIQDITAFELFLFFSMVVTAFWSNGIKNALLAKYNEEGIQKQHLVLASYLFLQITAVLAASVLYFFSEQLLPSIVKNQSNFDNVWFYLYVCTSPVIILIENLLYLEQKHKELDVYSYWSAALSLISIAVTAWVYAEIQLIYLVLCALTLLRYVYLLSILPLRSFSFRVIETLRPYVMYCLPLIFTMLLGSAMEMLDGLLVTHFFSPDQFPVYRYGARELPFSAMLFASLGSALIPVVQKDPNDHSAIRLRVASYMDLLFPLSIAAVFLSYPLFSVVYGKAFATSGHIFSLYLLIIASRCWMPQIYPQAFHQHKILIFSSVVELLVNVLLSLWWVTYWGIYGLVGATVGAYAIQKVILMFYNWKVNHVLPGDYMPISKYFSYLILLIGSLVASLYFYG